MTRLTVKSVTEYAQTHGYELEVRNSTKDKYHIRVAGESPETKIFETTYRTLNDIMLCINEGHLLDGQSESVEFEIDEQRLSNSELKASKQYHDFVATGNTESYLNDSGEHPTFEEVATAIAPYGYELHRNNGQFFTESKAPYIYFKSGQSEYALHVTYFLDTILDNVQEFESFMVNNQRYQQIAFELFNMNDVCPDDYSYMALSNRLKMLEKRLINAVEQRRLNVRQICSEIGQMVREWSSGQGFGNTVKRVSRKVARHAKRFYTMLTERVAPKYTVQ
ncbi:hypothetical protein [Nostoc phage A1]|nr:hypothetical protein [Nostoc phage A1]